MFSKKEMPHWLIFTIICCYKKISRQASITLSRCIKMSKFNSHGLRGSVNMVTMIFLAAVSCHSVSALTYQDAFDVESDILVNYSTGILPVEIQNDTMYISVKVYLQSISELNEISGQLTATMGLLLLWNDSQLTWNPTKYGGMTKLGLEASKIWTPDLLLANSGRKIEILGQERSKVIVNNFGTVEWVIMDVMYSICDVDVTYFPLDVQVCKIIFITYVYGNQLQFRVLQSEVDSLVFIENGVFYLLKTEVSADFYASNHSTGTHTLTVTLYLKRRPLFYSINLLAPILLLALLNSAVFLLPAESGERVGFSVTILLSITVYMTIVAYTLPDTSKPVSILIYILAVCLLQSTLICLETILGLNIFHRSDSVRVSRSWIKFLHMLAFCNCSRNQNVVRDISEDQSHRREKTKTKCSFERECTWTDVAKSLDKLFFRSTIVCNCAMVLIYSFIVCIGHSVTY